ncbi:MAG: methylated-DNA--[protein]-cysteine S-methyltransferase [Thermodesulfobacteriota bacterium]
MIQLHDFHTDMGRAWIARKDPGAIVVEIGLPGTFSPEVIDRYRCRYGEGIRYIRSTSDDDIIHAVQSYFSGRKIVSFPFWHRLEFGSMTDTRIQVLWAVYAIPYGQTRTYSSIAAEIGKPTAGRFVGNTMATNPFPVIIPCHRVIRKDGSLGGFGGGIDLKRRMLDMECHVIAS